MWIAWYELCTSVFDEILDESLLYEQDDVFLEFDGLTLIWEYFSTIFEKPHFHRGVNRRVKINSKFQASVFYKLCGNGLIIFEIVPFAFTEIALGFFPEIATELPKLLLYFIKPHTVIYHHEPFDTIVLV